MPVVSANDIEIYLDDFGDPGDPPLVLVAGLGAQCTNYDDDLCWRFVERGMRVIRFDNRDIGLSTKFAEGDSYTLSDMAADTLGVLDALELDSVHLWGSSLGGMIAQTVAIEHPDRVRTLISVQSNTGEPDVGLPESDTVAALLANLTPSDTRDEAIAKSTEVARILTNNDLLFDPERTRRRQESFYDRAYFPGGGLRQMAAAMLSGSRAEGLARLSHSTLVIHGRLDPLIRFSGGERTAELVPDSTLVAIDDMGHDLNPAFWPTYVDAVISHVAAHEAAA